MNIIEEAIDLFPTQKEFAEAIDATESYVSTCRSRGFIHSKYWERIERVTEGKITIIRLCKSIHPTSEPQAQENSVGL